MTEACKDTFSKNDRTNERTSFKEIVKNILHRTLVSAPRFDCTSSILNWLGKFFPPTTTRGKITFVSISLGTVCPQNFAHSRSLQRRFAVHRFFRSSLHYSHGALSTFSFTRPENGEKKFKLIPFVKNNFSNTFSESNRVESIYFEWNGINKDQACRCGLFARTLHLSLARISAWPIVFCITL